MRLSAFKQSNFVEALKMFFSDLNVPVNYVTQDSTTVQEILKDTYKESDAFALIDDVYFVGMVDDSAFSGGTSLHIEQIKSDYDGILIFGITLKARANGLLPTRAQLAEIARSFNREFYYTPVIVVFKYEHYIAFANTERLKYRQEWREGEKAGKVTLLRDVDVDQPHSGHERILSGLKIPTSGSLKINSFSKLYEYWQQVFSVNVLNKKFYQELSSWYFWAIQNVSFPGAPTSHDAFVKKMKLDDLVHEHNATNVIRLLTRLLFVWFIKEKKLIPEDLFELDTLQKDILKEISPFHDEGMFKDSNKHSVYYKAILQNLFFATLNCPIESDNLDKRKRDFRGEGYGTHRGIDYLMRYRQYFKQPEKFLEKLNSTVPFLNGGLFECLDDKFNNVYIDGFSDQMIKGEQLIVPDYLFFGLEEHADLSDIVGIADKKYKNAAVKGLINILKSYKFTITENTPIEEDVALDPELLGKVFENLLASYNPETKSTARKQTGSYYTPREIVNYMVDESLIAFLKKRLSQTGLDANNLENDLRVLTSFDKRVPFGDTREIKHEIIKALSECTILDPACGSGAFPMGALQKMVHVLQKLDPDNKIWKDVQLKKAEQESKAAFEIENKDARTERLLEINEAFDQSINDPDYARKLFLIENCIYGVDIQPIATQISKLRFFISLVVEQKVDSNKPNFGIRPLPNLETKFVAANTLIGIEKPDVQLSLYETDEVKVLEAKLKAVRHKLFSAKSKETKLKYRQLDQELRAGIAVELQKAGWATDTAEKLSGWDPYDQNASSVFFDGEWMFDVTEGFDIVIGNPPYINANELKKKLGDKYEKLKEGYESAKGTIDIYILFIEFGLKALSRDGSLCYITPNRFLSASYGEALREFIHREYSIRSISDFSSVQVFEAASTYPIVTLIARRDALNDFIEVKKFDKKFSVVDSWFNDVADLELLPGKIWGFLLNSKISIVKRMLTQAVPLSDCGVINATSTAKEADDYHKLINEESGLKLVNTGTIDSYLPLWGKEKLTDKGETYLMPYLREDIKRVSQQRLKLYRSPKIIVAKIALKLEAFYDKNGEYASINTNCIHSFKKGFRPEYVAVWVNSKLFHFVFSCFFDGLRMAGGYLLYSAPNLKSTFIKKPGPEYEDLFRIFHGLLSATAGSSKFQLFDEVANGLFFELYFGEHMFEEEINIFEFVKSDVENTQRSLSSEDFDNLGLLANYLHAKWSSPDNKVRDRIKLFSVRSPEILKTILETI
ncbi:MAG: Eco57I restriction-modification methylase domain-containing protein [Flavipsychrobacter sp.]|nr:Eco57I restriction-modification methylase domain-containing protein [Flavipsychrobacter sp.]